MSRPPYDDGDETQLFELQRRSSRRRAVPGARDRLTLTVLAGPARGRVIAASGDELVVGRAAELPERIDDPGMSRRHARFFRRAGEWFLEDLGSKNGTFLKGRQVHDPEAVADGDRVEVGSETVLLVSLHDAAAQELALSTYESSVTDPLTRLHNRRYFEDRLAAEMAFAARHGTELSLLLIDADHFKAINDGSGHEAGDATLRVLGATIRRMVRTEDVVARLGGEEFAVLARGIGHRNALILAERIRKVVAGCQVPWEGGEIRVTVSIGVATRTAERPFPSGRELLAAADAAVYRAKRSGRNRVTD
ncbi:MAG: GGDEF domain-containing protein [Myxococcota bacterium]|nr:GGDEF domain-containing protein [Myxococcota bacterium]MDW8363804.1 GGDEF domain-containing protein [Myxococcales bacterium]